MDNNYSQAFSYKSYVIGFVMSIALTLAAYVFVARHVSSGHEGPHRALLIALIALAVAQLIVQAIAFLHLGAKSDSRWNVIVFVYTALLVVFLVGGSLWIMSHLNYNMMLMPPAQVDTYMLNQ